MSDNVPASSEGVASYQESKSDDPGHHENPVRVLMVDDEENEFVLIRYLLSEINENDFEMSWSSTYSQGFETLQREHFDVALIDYRLAEGDGLRLIEELKKYGCTTPLIVLTSKGDDMIAVRAMKLGASDYLNKNRVSGEALQRSILNAIDREKMRQQVERQQRQLQHLARHDELTGLLNRRALFEYLQLEFYRMIRYELDLSILMLDLDYFKQVNDKYGHRAGDQVLEHTARLIQETVRNIDIVARYGGEEFVIVLPQTPLEGARVIAERLRRRIAKHKHSCRNELFSLTCSIGAALARHEDQSLEEALERADQALYAAKNEGRDRVVINSAEQPA